MLYKLHGKFGIPFLFMSLQWILFKPCVFITTAAWLAQLVERQSAVREDQDLSPRPDQHSESCKLNVC